MRDPRQNKVFAFLEVEQHPKLRKPNRVGKLIANQRRREDSKWGGFSWRHDDLHGLREHRRDRKAEAEFVDYVSGFRKVVAELEDPTRFEYDD